MQQVDIKRMFSILAAYQELDPETAETLLARILKAIKEHYDTERREKIL